MGNVASCRESVIAGPRRLLVIRGGAIGDFILTLPVLAALRRRFPQSHLELLGSPPILELATLNGLAHHARSLESRGLAEFFVRGGTLDAGWRDYFSGFSIIVSYLHDPEGAFRENLGASSAAEFIPGAHRLEDGSLRHATRVLLEPLERLDILKADPIPRLPVDGLPPADLPPGCWLALHPGSGSERKNWPEEKWRGLVLELVAVPELNLLLVGGEAEVDRLERLMALVPSGRVRMARGLPLLKLAGLLSRCRGFVGHDSGISHLAAALGLPGVVIWGPSSPDVWRPLGDGIAAVGSREGIAGISVPAVREKTRRLLQKSAGLPGPGC